MYDLDHCRVCGKDLPDRVKEWAHHRIEEQTCSTECNVTFGESVAAIKQDGRR